MWCDWLSLLSNGNELNRKIPKTSTHLLLKIVQLVSFTQKSKTLKTRKCYLISWAKPTSTLLLWPPFVGFSLSALPPLTYLLFLSLVLFHSFGFCLFCGIFTITSFLCRERHFQLLKLAKVFLLPLYFSFEYLDSLIFAKKKSD